MHGIDWALTFGPIAIVLGCAVFARRYVRSVADFVAGGRVAGRYVICNAHGQANSGVANTLSKFELLLLSGFVLSWWDTISFAILMAVSISGFVVYRFRQTRAMTIGQFFEMRYSRRFRLFAGGIGFVAGLLNYGIFPAVASGFFIYFLALPLHVSLSLPHWLGGAAWLIPTRELVMGGYLACTLCIILIGGQVTLLLTDALEGIFTHGVFIVVVIAVLIRVGWQPIRQSLLAAPPGYSMVNPFDQMQTPDFNVGYAAMTLVMVIYGTMATQKDNGFSAAARTPHEARMGGVLGLWRVMARGVVLLVLTLAAFSVLRDPVFPGAPVLHAVVDPHVRSEMAVPVALRFLLPTGVKGLFCCAMMMGLIAGDASHMLTWGGVFIQDVVLPLRATPMTPRQHLLLLRISVMGVALFAFIFSAFFQPREYIAMWWAVTEGVFVCGGGAAIIGGLYWRKGTTVAVWCAFVTGATCALAGVLAPYLWPTFPLNGREVQLGAAALASAVYVGVSLLTCRRDFDMDALLHRGAAEPVGASQPAGFGSVRTWLMPRRWPALLNANPDFSPRDKLVVGSIAGWSALWCAVVLVGTSWNLLWPWSDSTWLEYWLIAGVLLPGAVLMVTFVWFAIGGVIDLRTFFQVLSRMRRDARDDGTVAHSPGSAPSSQARVAGPSPAVSER